MITVVLEKRLESLSKYKIRDPSEDDIDNLLNDYKSKIGGG
jgi:hypothetical protein